MTTTHSPRVVLALAAVVILSANQGFTQPAGGNRASIDAALSGGVALDDHVRVIVRHRPGSTARLRRQLEDHGDRINRQQDDDASLAVEIHRRDLATLASHPDVIGLSLDSAVAVRDWQATGNRGGVSEIQPLRTWLGVPASAHGAGVGIAIIDSGVAATIDVAPAASYDFNWRLAIRDSCDS